MAAKGLIDVKGITQLTRDFGKIDKDLRASLVKEVRLRGDKLRDEIRASTAAPYRTGKLRRSVKTSVRGGTVAIYSKEPYGNVAHWGGTVSPRGVPIRFPRTAFIWGPAKAAVPRITEEMKGILEATALRYGFRP